MVESAERAELKVGEAVRLVVWDLDDTFWKGTVSEGGIKQYIQANHDIVIELARRGIMSSICSKNDEERIRKILYATGILDYFVFPSISWDPKGPRLEALIEIVQLRPANVMFIDDNPSNRAEAAVMVPGLQIEDETFISRMLDDPRFVGKDDSELTRLAQYKLLEARKKDEVEADGDNEAFLRASDITVHIDFDIEPSLDRVVELVNRTNQLNFIKRRLPENLEEARSALRTRLKGINTQAGVVSVRDRYGDYGIVGFYLLNVQSHSLEQFCFSCRALGMGVETWLFDLLRQPEMLLAKPVAVDLFVPHPPIDWIRQLEGGGSAEVRPTTGRILLRGACDLQAVAHYFAVNAADIVVEHDTSRDDRPIISNHTTFNNAALLGLTPEQIQAAESIGFRREDFSSELVEDSDSFDAIVLSFWAEAMSAIYRHKTSGLVTTFYLQGADNGRDATKLSAEEASRYNSNAAVSQALEVLRRDFEYIGWTLEAENGSDVVLFEQTLDRVFERVPSRTPIFILLACDEVVDHDGNVEIAYHLRTLNDVTRAIAARWNNIILIDVRQSIKSPDDVVDATHFNRMVYYRIYQNILAEWSKWKSDHPN